VRFGLNRPGEQPSPSGFISGQQDNVLGHGVSVDSSKQFRLVLDLFEDKLLVSMSGQDRNHIPQETFGIIDLSDYAKAEDRGNSPLVAYGESVELNVFSGLVYLQWNHLHCSADSDSIVMYQPRLSPGLKEFGLIRSTSQAKSREGWPGFGSSWGLVPEKHILC